MVNNNVRKFLSLGCQGALLCEFGLDFTHVGMIQNKIATVRASLCATEAITSTYSTRHASHVVAQAAMALAEAEKEAEGKEYLAGVAWMESPTIQIGG